MNQNFLVRTFVGHTNWAHVLAFSPNGRYLATEIDTGVVSLSEVITGQEIRRWKAHPENISRVAFSPNSQYLATGSDDKTVKVWEVSSAELIQTFDNFDV